MTPSETIFGLAGLLAPLVLACLVFVIWRQRRALNSQPAGNVPTRALDLVPWVRLFAAEDFLLLAGRPALRHRLRRNRNRVARLYLRDLERHCRELRRVAPWMAPAHTEALWLEMLKLAFLSKVLRAQLLLGAGPLPAAMCRSVAGIVEVLERAHQVRTSIKSPRALRYRF